MTSWKNEIRGALAALGGEASLDAIYAAVRDRRADLPPSWQATIRGTIEQASSDSVRFRVGSEDTFYSVDGLGSGRWGLRGGVQSVTSFVAQEVDRRAQMWSFIQQAEKVTASLLKGLDVYRGQAGIFFDRARTESPLSPHGAAVSFLHTGRSYADDLSDDGLLYHYPSTKRKGSHDEGEVNAARAASQLGLPVFAIIERGGGRREVRRGYIEELNDEARVILITFSDQLPQVAQIAPEQPFEAVGERAGRVRQWVQHRPNQQRFKNAVFQRYGPACVVCDVDAAGVVAAAHLRPKKAAGADDARNGLPLCANHHVAMDRGLWRINPDGNTLDCAPGQSRAKLRMTRMNLSHLRAQPHEEVIRWLWGKNFKPI